MNTTLSVALGRTRTFGMAAVRSNQVSGVAGRSQPGRAIGSDGPASFSSFDQSAYVAPAAPVPFYVREIARLFLGIVFVKSVQCAAPLHPDHRTFTGCAAARQHQP